MLLCYFPCWLVQFFSNPCLIRWYPFFFSKIFPLSSVVCCRTRRALMREGGMGSHGWRIIVHGFARKIVLERDLMCQPEAWCGVPVWIPVPQGDGELSSVNHDRIRPHYRNCDPTINPASHMGNGFIHFCCHESTQIHEYNPGHPSLARHQQKEQTDKMVSIALGSA